MGKLRRYEDNDIGLGWRRKSLNAPHFSSNIAKIS